MTNYQYVFLYSLAGALFSLIGCLMLFFGTKDIKKMTRLITPFAAGALLAAVFLDLLRDGLEVASSSTLLISVLAGIVLFFYGERFLEWFHHNHEEIDNKRDPALALIIVGNGLHNALDGVAIAAAFLINVPTGIITTFAVAVHEVPHNAADFGLLMHKGMDKTRALMITMLSNFTTVIVALIVTALGSSSKLPVGVMLGLSAGFLLYIAMSDIIPEIHQHTQKNRFFDWQPLLLLVGLVIVGIAIQLAHYFAAV